MDSINLLSGTDLLRKGLEKVERTLPVKGDKDVTPTGSWIEQKQIQAALEARKHLLGDERIEKWGVLSHAEWDKEKQLALVTEQRGGHWNFLGHCVDKQLYLYPEEALFLMEVNCLELKFAGVQVSLQQAYSLLLNGTVNRLEYKVYSELSRVGYKVLRTTIKTLDNTSEHSDASMSEANTDDKEEQVVPMDVDNQINIPSKENEKKENSEHNENLPGSKEGNDNKDIAKSNVKENNKNKETVKGKDTIESDSNKQNSEANNEMDNKDKITDNITAKGTNDEDINTTNDGVDKVDAICKKNKLSNDEDAEVNTTQEKHIEPIQAEDWRKCPIVMVMGPTLEYPRSTSKMEFVNLTDEETGFLNNNQTHRPSLEPMRMPRCRSRIRALSSLQLPDYFECIPKTAGKDTVTVCAPDEQYLPRNIFLNKTHYEFNLEDIEWKKRPTQPALQAQCQLTQTRPSLAHAPLHNDAVFDAFLRQQNYRSMFCRWSRHFAGLPNFNIRHHQRFEHYARNRNFIMFPNQRFPYFPYRFNVQPQPNYFIHGAPQQNYNLPNNQNASNISAEQERAKKTADNSRKTDHLQSIRRFAWRLKKFQQSGNCRSNDYKTSLQKLIEAYNSRYNESLQLSENCVLLNDCTDADTIVLEEERPAEKRRRQRARRSPEPDKSDKATFLQRIKSMASQLKRLRASGERCFRNRRSLLNAIKIFNKKFNTRIVLNSYFEVKDCQQVVLDSSSDSDCMIVDEKKRDDSGWKAKRRKLSSSDRITGKSAASTSKDDSLYDSFQSASMRARKYYQDHTNFPKWLPSIDDWGRAEVVPTIFCHHRIVNSGQELYLYDYLNDYKHVDFRDWDQLKSEFWNTLKESTIDVDEEMPNVREAPPCDIEPLLSLEDCTDLASALKKVRIIKTYRLTVDNVTPEIRVTFDVYERDVKNFRKSDVPVPAFRIICLDECSPMPDVGEVVALQQPYRDSAPTVLAMVGATVSYVQMTPSDLPVYVKKRFI